MVAGSADWLEVGPTNGSISDWLIIGPRDTPPRSACCRVGSQAIYAVNFKNYIIIAAKLFVLTAAYLWQLHPAALQLARFQAAGWQGLTRRGGGEYGINENKWGA